MTLPQWNVVATPLVELTFVKKEQGARGYIFVVYPLGHQRTAWLSQSLPALTHELNKQKYAPKGTFHVSSFYRVARKSSDSRPQKQHLSWAAERYTRSQMQELNESLRRFDHLFFCVRDPDCWECRPPRTAAPDPGEEPGSRPAAELRDLPSPPATTPGAAPPPPSAATDLLPLS